MTVSDHAAPFLDSAWAKLQRAKHHEHCLGDLLDDYNRAQQLAVGRHIEPSTGRVVFKLENPLGEPPSNIAMIIGDTLFNYRSALDHLMQALIVQSGSVPNTRTQFPIFKDVEHFRSNGKSQMKGAHPTIAAIIRLQQKFANLYPVEADCLWQLHRLHNIDKHKSCHRLSIICEGVFSDREPSPLLNLGLEADRDPSVQFCTTGSLPIVGETLATFPGKYSNVPFVAHFQITFVGDEVANGSIVRYVVGNIGTTVESIVEQFTSLFFNYDSSALGRLYRPFHKDIEALRDVLSN